MYRMSTSACRQLMEKEDVINGTKCVESEPKPIKETVLSSEDRQNETLSDWLVMVCVLLTNALNGINQASYGVLYMPLENTFQSSRSAIGWIQSLDFALGSFLGECHRDHFLMRVRDAVCMLMY